MASVHSFRPEMMINLAERRTTFWPRGDGNDEGNPHGGSASFLGATDDPKTDSLFDRDKDDSHTYGPMVGAWIILPSWLEENTSNLLLDTETGETLG